MEHFFSKKVSEWKPLNIFAESSIIDLRRFLTTSLKYLHCTFNLTVLFFWTKPLDTEHMYTPLLDAWIFRNDKTCCLLTTSSLKYQLYSIGAGSPFASHVMEISVFSIIFDRLLAVVNVGACRSKWKYNRF